MVGDALTVACSIYLLHDVWRNIFQIVGGLAKTGVDGQEQVLAEHTLDDIFRRADHIVVLMSTFYLGQHHLIDVESLVDDADLLASLLLIPGRKVG